jgi:hypothetical protein
LFNCLFIFLNSDGIAKNPAEFPPIPTELLKIRLHPLNSVGIAHNPAGEGMGNRIKASVK